MKRLLCILSSLDTGGAETFMMKIFRSLPEDYKIDFIVSAKTGFYEKEVVELGGRIFRVPLRTKHPIKTFKAIYDVVKQNHYTHILKLCDTPIGIYDLLAAKMGGAKVLCVRSCNAGSSTSKLGAMVNDFLRAFFNYMADVKLAPSRLAAEFTFGKAEVETGKVNFIHNGVDLNVYKYDEENRRKVRSEFGITDEQLVVGHIGRFNQQKNHKFLIEVFAEVLKQKPDALLMLVGDGEKKSEIKEQIKSLGIEESVIFTGIRSDVPALLSAMDVFVFPSFYEGMPNTVIEAQATGLPCVIADTITEEVNLTSIIQRLSLLKDKTVWREKALFLINIKDNNRNLFKGILEKQGYSIYTTVDTFINVVWNK